MWAIVLLIFFVAGSCQISITEFSVPNSIESGGDVLLQCGYELNSNETAQGLTVKWWFTPLDQSDEERHQLYQRIAGQPPAKARLDIEIKGTDDILLQNVTPENSGTYECEVSAVEDEKRQHDDLFVFTKGEMVLNLTEVADGPDEDNAKDVLITCEATDVAPYPDLVITVNEKVLNSEASVISRENDTFDVSYNVTLSSDEVNGADISCELFYKNVNITHEPYKITRTFNAYSALTTTEDFEDDSTTEATSDNRDACIGPTSSFLLVMTALFLNIFTVTN